MRVLHAAAELFPLIKVGGLGDVLGALPQALRALGVDARVLLPGFPAVLKGIPELREVERFQGLPGQQEGRILEGRLASDVPAFVLDVPDYFGRSGGPYDEWGDSHLKFAAFSMAAARIGRHGAGGWKPEVLHCHDWQTGLAPAYLAQGQGAPPASVMTIHNLAYQGIYGSEVFPLLGLPDECFQMHGLEFHGKVNFLKAGLVYARKITTVSPTYAREIQTPEAGWYLEGLLAHRAQDLVGILNGADYRVWSPSCSPHLVRPYDASDLRGKAACKKALQQEMGLQGHAGSPLFGVVSRLAPQKGLDMVLENVAHLVDQGAQLVLLGSGEGALEQGFAAAAARHPGQVAVRIGYDEGLAHRILAGSDVLTVPSRQEPCGLTQIYALKYGTLPLVRRTGGLADTVVDATEEALQAGTATGFVFGPPSSWVLGETLGRAATMYKEQPDRWRQLQLQAMAQDYGWEAAGKAYLALYASLFS